MWWPRSATWDGTSLPCPACCHPNTVVPVPCCQPWASSQGLPPGLWLSTLPRNFGDQKPPLLLGRASSFSRPRCCSPVSISAVAVVWNTQRASPRITTSWAWLPISELHEADGIPYYLPILDLQKKTPDPPHLGHVPQFSSPGPYAKGVLPLPFSFLTPEMVTLLPCIQL